MWTIHLIRNTVQVPKAAVPELFAAQEDETWYEEEDVLSGGRLVFNSDHYEHMDFLADNQAIIDVLCKHRVKGDICLADLEQGDEEGSFWGYRFDGQGGMEKLKGKVDWHVHREPLKGQVICFTGKLSVMTRERAAERVEDCGGRVVNSLSSKVTHLVYGGKPGSKLAKAQARGIVLVPETEFIALIDQRVG
jgi:NAD-dependent DNA ligase